MPMLSIESSFISHWFEVSFLLYTKFQYWCIFFHALFATLPQSPYINHNTKLLWIADFFSIFWGTWETEGYYTGLGDMKWTEDSSCKKASYPAGCSHQKEKWPRKYNPRSHHLFFYRSWEEDLSLFENSKRNSDHRRLDEYVHLNCI